jgi:hypothetical protein
MANGAQALAPRQNAPEDGRRVRQPRSPRRSHCIPGLDATGFRASDFGMSTPNLEEMQYIDDKVGDNNDGEGENTDEKEGVRSHQGGEEQQEEEAGSP